VKIEPGTVWLHYKGDKYKIVSLARLESSSYNPTIEGTIVVVYHKFDHFGSIFARPIQEWLEVVDFAGKKKSRFEFFAKDEEAARSRMRCE
jgi:hypothetical protein